MEEIWRSVPGYNGYFVSNKEGLYNANTNNFLPGYIHEEYRVVTLDGTDVKYHRIVAKAFPDICGEWFEGCVVHHKDHNKLNNLPENLQVIKRGEHQREHNQERDYHEISLKAMDTIRKRYPHGRGARPIEQYNTNGALINTYNSIKEAAESNNVNSSSLCNYLKGRGLETYGGYIWKYKKED